MADLAVPPAPAGAALITFPDSGERRLRLALRNLESALAEQREAIAHFRSEIGALRGAVDGLGQSAAGLQSALAVTATQVAGAQHASRELAATAEMMERLARP
jgi:hypothetical protein